MIIFAMQIIGIEFFIDQLFGIQVKIEISSFQQGGELR